MLAEIEQFIAWVRMRSPLARTIAGLGEVQKSSLRI
jgi:hypothetical protein